MAGSARFRAIRFEQNDRVFYLAAATAGELLDISEVDIWSADKPQDETGWAPGYKGVSIRSELLANLESLVGLMVERIKELKGA